MPYKLPTPDVERRVSEELGDGFWPDFKASLDRVKLNDPAVNVTSWYRDPYDLVRVKAQKGRAAGLYSQHGAGIAVDLLASSLAYRERLAAAGRREGFSVRAGPPDYPPQDLHVHLAALPDQVWRRSPLFVELVRQVDRVRRPRAPLPVILTSGEGR